MKHKHYTSRPKKGMARKAWDYLQSQNHHPIEDMFYSRDCAYGQRWIAFHGHHGYGGYTGDMNSPVVGSNAIYTDVTTEHLRIWIDGTKIS